MQEIRYFLIIARPDYRMNGPYVYLKMHLIYAVACM